MLMKKPTILSTHLFLLLLVASLKASSQTASITGIVYENNYAKVPFKTAEGAISVFLPDDMAAGDHITGTVIVEPTGKNDKEKNLNRLRDIDVRIGNTLIDLKKILSGPSIASNHTSHFVLDNNW